MTPKFKKFCEKRFRDAVIAEFGTTMPFYFSNVAVPETIESYVVMHVIASSETFQIAIDRKSKERNVGIVQIDVYTPKDTGSRDGSKIAWELAKYFRRVQLAVDEEGTVTFRSPTVADRGEVRNRHKEMVSAPYFYDFMPEMLQS